MTESRGFTVAIADPAGWWWWCRVARFWRPGGSGRSFELKGSETVVVVGVVTEDGSGRGSEEDGDDGPGSSCRDVWCWKVVRSCESVVSSDIINSLT